MSDAPKSDVRSAIEWAWVNYDRCVVRDEKKIAIALDFEKATTDAPPGGKQFLDLAFTNKVAFYKDFVMKALGTDIDNEDEVAIAEKKSMKELRALLVRFEDENKAKKAKPKE